MVTCSVRDLNTCPSTFWCHVGSDEQTTLCCPGCELGLRNNFMDLPEYREKMFEVSRNCVSSIFFHNNFKIFSRVWLCPANCGRYRYGFTSEMVLQVCWFHGRSVSFSNFSVLSPNSASSSHTVESAVIKTIIWVEAIAREVVQVSFVKSIWVHC